MRFLGLGLSDRVPDAADDLAVPEKLTKAGAIQLSFKRFDATRFGRTPATSPCRVRSLHASLIAAPRQRNSEDEKKAIKRRPHPTTAWKEKPAKLRQKDRHAHDPDRAMKFTKAKPREDGPTPPVDLAIPVFGYQSHIPSIAASASIRSWSATGRRRL